MKICIDASNIIAGGGLTHLYEILNAANPEKYGIKKIIVWAPQSTLNQLDDKPWLEKNTEKLLESNIIKKLYWQRYKLTKLIIDSGCDILFVPGGNYIGTFKPYITMCRNMLPFQREELLRFGISLKTIRFLVLRILQSRTFKNSNGIIFLTSFAKKSILQVIGELMVPAPLISHGLNRRFKIKPRQQKSITTYTNENPYRLIYVSTIDEYKHQWHVIEAVGKLRHEGYQIILELIGTFYPPSLHRLKTVMKNLDPNNEWVFYNYSISHDKLHQKYLDSDLGLFASSCENMPNILLEIMGAGLPIACSNREPMPEILGEGGEYFNPEEKDSIYNAIIRLINSPSTRAKKAEIAFNMSEKYSWDKCSNQTFKFLSTLVK